MKRIIIALCLVATVARAEYTATFGSVAVTNNLRVTDNITAGGSIAVTNNITAGEDLRVAGYTYLYKDLAMEDGANIDGVSLDLSSTLDVEGESYFGNSVAFESGSVQLYPAACLSVDGYLYTYGTNAITSWDRLQLDGSGETLPVYMSNVVAIATQQITAASIGALTNETDPVWGVVSNAVRAGAAAGATAWQNPASATNWTWTSDGTNITLTGYTGPNDVVIPDMLDGLPVTGFGTIFDSTEITSISGGANVAVIGDFAFSYCTALTSVSLPSAVTLGRYALRNCTALTSVNLPSAVIVGNVAFYGCTALSSISLPSAVTVVTNGFYNCPALTSVYFSQNAPAEEPDVYDTPNVTNYVTSPTATGWTNSWNGRPVVRLPVYADNFYGDGSGLTNITAAKVGAVTPGEASNIVIAVGTAQGWSTNTAWTWQGAQIVAVDTSAYSIAYGGPAAWSEASNRYDVLPYSTTNYGAITGTVTITMASNRYLNSIGGTWHIKTESGTAPKTPVSYSVSYTTSTSAVLSAWCSTEPADATSDYYAYFSNLVVYSYDRPGMTPCQYTNDAAGIVARVDPLPTGNTDPRRVVNSESLDAAIAAAKPDIAKEAWAYMPSGARQPTYNAVTLDKPLIQQSAGVTFMQSGDYFAQSYAGTWDATVTGSVWRVGPSGRTALEIASTNINLAITAFTVRTNVATFVIATNWVVGTPHIEQCADLMAPQWLYVAGQSVTDDTTNWTAACSTVATMRFFRAISPGGANKITSAYSHVFNAGISDGTNAMPSRSLYVVTNANGSGCTITGFFSVTP
jgi:hypothetical protein